MFVFKLTEASQRNENMPCLLSDNFMDPYYRDVRVNKFRMSTCQLTKMAGGVMFSYDIFSRLL